MSEESANTTNTNTNDPAKCTLCGMPVHTEEEFVEHLKEVCEYNTVRLNDMFRESLPREILELGLMKHDDPVTAATLYSVVHSLIARQDKINAIYQFRLAKLAIRAVGAGAPESPTKWCDI